MIAPEQHRCTETGEREQGARADGEKLRIVMGDLGAASGQEAVRCRERNGEDDGGAKPKVECVTIEAEALPRHGGNAGMHVQAGPPDCARWAMPMDAR